MTRERWRLVSSVLQAALERESASRAAFLSDACGADALLRREVESLLGAAPPNDFLERAGGPEGSLTLALLTSALAERYAVVGEVGHGGMATVYLAEDLRHRRRVAIKVVHPELSAVLGPDRFLKEIEVTASLQHPHILPLFDSGRADGLLYYVMPYVDGETLRARLVRDGQLAVEEAVRLAREVAEALAYAHARGVVHRDVKPENVLLHGGHALVADFGIAMAVERTGVERITQSGFSVGTPQYMAPEQAAGARTIDARADVYALGAMLYEMLAGEPPFTGPSAQAIVARVMTESPPSLVSRRRSVPPAVDDAVRVALEKLPADRFQSAAAFAAALSAPALTVGRAMPAVAAGYSMLRPISKRSAAMVALGALLALASAWALGRAGRRVSPGAAPTVASGPVRFIIAPDSGSLGTGGPAISPDGRTLVYALERADGRQLFVQRIDELVGRPIAGTEDGEQPFFSPDGAWIAFYSHGALRKVRPDGGAPIVVTEIPPAMGFAGGSWGDDGSILFADSYWDNGLFRVPARGGAPTRVRVADSTWAYDTPHLLPGAQAALVVTAPIGATTGQRFAVLDLATGIVRRFGVGLAPRYVAGQMLYTTAAGELYRQSFDVRRLEPTGAAERIGTGLAYLMGGEPPFDVSATGAMVYRVGGSQSSAANLKLTVIDRAGRELQAIPARMPWAPRFSPDGRRVAYGAQAAGRESSDLWITDLESGATQRLTTDANDNNDPQWSPDGSSIAFSADTDGAKDVFVRGLDAGAPQLLTRRAGHQFAQDWLRDGSAVLFVDVQLNGARAGDQNLWVQPLHGGASRAYVATTANEVGARAAPDADWIAYTSDETGREEVYVQSYPAAGRKALISARGGIHPAWRGDGRELYYWENDQLVAVRLERGSGGALVVHDRTPLFQAAYAGGITAMYDVSPDGERFVVAAGYERANRLVVALGALGAGAASGGDRH